MTAFNFGGRTYSREALDAIYDFAIETNTPFDWWFTLGFGESTLNVNAVGDGGDSVNIFQGNRVHGDVWDTWRGVDGLSRLMAYMWGNRWEAWWTRFGAWAGWIGTIQLPDPATLPKVFYQGREVPIDPRVPLRGRAAYLYFGWPMYQGSTRPTWERACQVESEATALALYYAEKRCEWTQPPSDAETIATLRAALLDTRRGLIERMHENQVTHGLMVEGIDNVFKRLAAPPL